MSSRYVWNRNALTAQETNKVSGSAYNNAFNFMNFDPADKFWGWKRDSWQTSYYVITNGPIITNSSTAYVPYSISNGKFVVNSPTRRTLTSSNLVYDQTNYTSIVYTDDRIVDWDVYFGINQSGTNSYDRLYHVTTKNTGYRNPEDWGVAVTVDNELPTEMAITGSDDFTYTGSILRLAQGTLVDSVSNAASTAYPPQNYDSKLAKIWP